MWIGWEKAYESWVFVTAGKFIKIEVIFFGKLVENT
jgi:hypothetical protein